MVFSSTIFVFLFLPLVILCYFLSPKKIRNYVLLLFSIIFYLFGGPKFLAVLLTVVLIDYIGAILIDKTKYKKFFLLLTLIGNISILVYFKYTGFFVENINHFLGLDINIRKIVLPIGKTILYFPSFKLCYRCL